jgi:ParB family chromosome partitioning protein
LIYIVPDFLERFARHALGAKYGVFSYDHLPKQTFIQTMAQLNRFTGDQQDNRSPTYEDLVIPWLRKHPRARVLDFGCGKGDYVERLAHEGFDIIGLEFFRRSRHENKIDVVAVTHMVDAVERSLSEHGLFDAVVCDYVLNSVDSLQAESDVMACVSALCRQGGTVWLSGRRREQVDCSMRSQHGVNIRAKRNIEFLDENGFSGLYRSGRWFYQKFHTAREASELMDRFGVTVVKKTAHHSSWQIEGRVLRRVLADGEKVAALKREFNMPLNDAGRLLGRDASIAAAYEKARKK